MAFEELSLQVSTKPRIPTVAHRPEDDDPIGVLLGVARVQQDLSEASILQELQQKPGAEELISSGWTKIALQTEVAFYDPEMAREVANRHSGSRLGPVLKVLQEKAGQDADRLRAAKRIGLKYVARDPAVDISWLPESIVKPKNAFLTLAIESGDATAEVRDETVIKRKQERTLGAVDHTKLMDTFFDNGHPDFGVTVNVGTVVSDEEWAALQELYGQFCKASHAVIAAAVSENFSITAPTPNELWTPVNR